MKKSYRKPRKPKKPRKAKEAKQGEEAAVSLGYLGRSIHISPASTVSPSSSQAEI